MTEDEFTEGELFVYTNGNRWELGMVKRPNNTGDGYFCWYSTGDTAANTPTSCMHKLANCGYTKIEAENEKLRELVSVMPYCMDTRCLECPLCSKFDPSIGGVPECMAGAKLYELGIEVNE